jgi:hypothetical protein
MKKSPTPAVNPERRRFLKQTAGTSLIAGVGPLLASCMGGGGEDQDAPALPGRPTELRSYFFDLSNANQEHDFFLVAGTTHHPLTRATPDQLTQATATNASLQGLATQNFTHVGEALPMAASIQTCYVKGVPKGGVPGEWHMHTMFYHVPAAHAALGAQQMTQACGKNLPTSVRADYHACLREMTATGAQSVATQLRSGVGVLKGSNVTCSDPDYAAFKDYFDHAMAMICHHPEIGSFDGPTLAYVQQAIVCADPNLLQLAGSLYNQGPATTIPGGWATLVEYKDPVTGVPKLAANGDKLYFTQYSDTTLRLTGLAINSILPKVKNDPALGANITGLGKDNLNAGLQGKLWATREGTPTRLPVSRSLAARALKAPSASLLQGAVGPSFAARDMSAGHGYRVDNVAGVGRTVSFTIDNWYLRYLGLYVRFLDAAGNPIPRSSLPAATLAPFHSELSGTYDNFLDLVNQELVILGIPVKTAVTNYSVGLPANAASMQILAGGIGSGSNSYPETVKPGAVMTVTLDLAIPGLFLATAAVSGYSRLSEELSYGTRLLVDSAKVLALAITDGALAGTYNDPKVFLNLVVPMASALKDAAELYAAVQAALAEGRAEGAAEDCIPFGIGVILQAVLALATVFQMAETSAEIATSPWTFLTQVDATHDLTVTINHDPKDTQGFPETATYYMLRAVCDGGSPAESGRIPMQATTCTQPLAYTFNGLPSGGKVTVTVAFYSATDWLAGTGTTGAVDNTQDSASITIKENLVPLTASTVYSHKQKIALDSAGRHIWVAAPQPVAQPASCNNVAGSQCILESIAVNETFGAVGYVWQAYGSGVPGFATGAVSQLYQFASLSFTDQPESGWLHSGRGFTAPPRLAYSLSSPTSQNFYLDTSTGRAIVRRVNMTAVNTPPTFDAPDSNQAVGSFNFSSDAFLIHPTGKLISLNSSLGKLEVLVPANGPVADASAPLAQAYAGPGTREGLLNGPVHAVVAPNGAILVLEQGGNRIQAFDTGANPTPFFAGKSTMQLKPQAGDIVYLDMAIEFIGYLYVLSRNTASGRYSMDIYTPAGALLATTNDMNVAKLAIDLFRNVFTLNFETIQPVGGITQPSISEWIPSTP